MEKRKLEYEKLQYILFSMPYCSSHNYKGLWPFSTIYQKISSCLFVLEGILCTLVLLQCSSSVTKGWKIKKLPGLLCHKWHNQITLFWKKNRVGGDEDMEFPGVLKKEHVEISRDWLKKKRNFQGIWRKNHVEFPWPCLGFRPWNFN